MTSYAVTIWVDVTDEEELYEAAYQRYWDDNSQASNPGEGANDILKPRGEIDVHACLVMLFDPGISPDGCKILDSSVE